MRVLRPWHLPRPWLYPAFVSLALLLSACQLVTPAPEARLQLDPRSSTASTGSLTSDDASGRSTIAAKGGAAAVEAPLLTYTIKRGTLRGSLAMSGKVVPMRTTQLTLRGSGTVTTVHVRPGQSVHEGDPLVEFVLDEESLQNARTQATLAELAYESERAKLDQMTAGADKAPLEQLNATIARDRAELQKLELERDSALTSSQRVEQNKAIAREAADRRVALAEVAVQAAEDSLTDSQAAAQRAEDNVRLVQSRTRTEQEQAQADATAAAEMASAAVRAAERRVQEATTKVSQAQLLWAATRVNQEIAMLKLRVDRDQAALKDAKEIEQAARTRAEAVSAAAATRGAQRDLAADQLALDQAQSNLGAARLTDEADVRFATIGLEQAKDDLTQARANEQRAQERVARLSKQADSPLPRATSDQSDPLTLLARARDAQHKLDSEQINLDGAQAARAALDSPDPQAQFASLSLDAAKAQLEADAARVADLENGPAADEVQREQTRVGLLRDQATAAAASAQPVVVLKAPFDATVTDLGVSQGQTVAPQISGVTAGVSAPEATAGKTSDGRQVAVRLAGAGTTSIVANASETDVNQLNVGQSVSLSFPGLPGQDTTGTIAEVAAAPTVQGTTVTYPLRIDVPKAPPQLRVGMSVQLGAEVDQARDVLIVPLDAIRSVGGQSLVARIDGNGIATDVPVNIGRTAGTTAEIVSGVKEGDVVAVYSQVTASVR